MAFYSRKIRQSFLHGALLSALGSAALFMLVYETSGMRWLENGTYDARVRLLDRQFGRAEERGAGGKEGAGKAANPGGEEPGGKNVALKDPPAGKYVVIDIDNASFDQLKPLLGRWPWSRAVWTEVIRYAAKGKPKAIGVDIVFGGAESAEADKEFARVVEKAGNVVLAYSFSDTAMDLEKEAQEAEKDKLKTLAREQHDAVFGEAMREGEVALNVPLPELGQAAAGLGAINSTPDSDGMIRRVPLQFVLEGKSYPGFPLRVANLVGNRVDVFSQAGSKAARTGQELPVDAKGRMVLVWGQRALRPARIPLWQVICSIYPTKCPAEVQKIGPEYFHDKIVMLGASAAGSYDFHPTPLGEQTPGFIAQVNAIDDILSGTAVAQTPRWGAWVIITLMAFAGAALLLGRMPVSLAALAAAGTAAAYGLAAVVAFGVRAGAGSEAKHLWMPIAAPLLSLTTSFVAAALVRYATTGRELRRTRGTLDRYISPALVKYVLENPESVNLAGEKRELTILFSDVRNFTTMTESSDPMELIRTLNEYLEQMTDVIFKYDGITDKFIGDGILAYWGAFTPGRNHAELGAEAALEMLERLKVLNARWRGEGRKELAIGIGLNTGEVVFGNVGSGKKIEFTVIGDAVNLAARLESQTKEAGVQAIVSEATRAMLGPRFRTRALGGVKVKGKTVETTIFELQGIEAEGGEVQSGAREPGLRADGPGETAKAAKR